LHTSKSKRIIRDCRNNFTVTSFDKHAIERKMIERKENTNSMYIR
jgi:hypothetical protein